MKIKKIINGIAWAAAVVAFIYAPWVVIAGIFCVASLAAIIFIAIYLFVFYRWLNNEAR